MSEFPLVSIVTPSFNQAKYLEETIISVLNQDYPNTEYLIMDGGSSDGSIDVIRKYEHRLAFWISEKDDGQAHAINKGWRRSRGEIVAYLNSDDIYMQGAISKAVRAFAEHPEWAMLYGDCGLINESGAFIGSLMARPFDLKSLLLRCTIGQPAVFIRRSALETVGMLDESFHMAMDYDLWMRLGLSFPIGHLSGEHLADFRVHASAKSSAQALRFTKENELVIRRTLQDPRLPFPPAEIENKALGALYFRHAAMLVSRREHTDARSWFLQAIRSYPGVARMYARNNEFFWVGMSVILGKDGMAFGIRLKQKAWQALIPKRVW
jgi:hypothetical protein